MDEKLMRKLSVFCSLAGLVALFVGAMVAEPKTEAISNLSEDFLGRKVVVSGKVVDLRGHPDNHLFLKLEGGSGGSILVPIFARVRAQLGEPIELLDFVQVTGTLKEYKGELEIVPDKLSDIRVTHTVPSSISSLGKKDLNGLVKVEGTVTKSEAIGKECLILTLTEGGCELPVFVPASVVEDGLPELRVGSRVRVGGLLQLYRERPELVLKSNSWLRVFEAA